MTGSYVEIPMMGMSQALQVYKHMTVLPRGPDLGLVLDVSG